LTTNFRIKRSNAGRWSQTHLRWTKVGGILSFPKSRQGRLYVRDFILAAFIELGASIVGPPLILLLTRLNMETSPAMKKPPVS
jgi:hypothetical protein